ncbi:calcium-binding protein [Dokdonella ginsengisoli]|uniref:Calcium-binding protein n=1 Tax=Dokdonella ginsengisoli TaxID=363846 RepID=A0ABV9QSP3_9GAMM
MPYVFTPPEQTQIQTFYNAGPTAPGQAGNFASMYGYIAGRLHAGKLPPDGDPEVLKSRLWFDGATKANGGSGVFSILIREYTQTQGTLHFGSRFSSQVGPLGIQEASNQVARNVYTTLSNNSWQLPTINGIATQDATAIGTVLFAGAPGDTGFTQNAAWSGAALFTMLGSDQTNRWVSTGASSVSADTLDDYRNLLFGRLSYEEALTSALVYAPYEAIQNEEMSGLISDMKTYAETCWMSGAFKRSGCLPTFKAVIKGTVAAPAFETLGMSLSGDRVVALMNSGYQGKAIAPSGYAASGDAFRLFKPIGTQGQSAATSVLSPDALYSQAVGTGSGALEAKQSLQALTPFMIVGGGSAAPGPDLAGKTPEYLADRRDMLTARLAFDGKDLAYGETLSGSAMQRGTTFRDDPASIVLTVDNPLLPLTPRVVAFGGSGPDVLSGGPGDDRLYGQAGNDTLTSGQGHDYMEGGLGSDTYNVVGGGAIIYDADGQGSVKFNQTLLTGGARQGADLWQSADSRFRFVRATHDETIGLLVFDNTTQQSFEIRDFLSGDLGIVLQDESNPDPPTGTTAPADTSVNGVRDYYEGSPLGDLIRAGAQYDYVFSYGGNDVIYGGPGADRFLSGPGADSVYGEEDNDYLQAGPSVSTDPPTLAGDTDVVAGGPGTDLVAGGVGDDVVYAGSPGDELDVGGTNAQGDWLMGGLGNDQVFGSNENDFINGGAGADAVLAGAGDDVVLGDGNFDFFLNGTPISFTSSSPGAAAKHTWNASTQVWNTQTSGTLPPGQAITIVLTPANHFQWTLGRIGDDFTFQPVVARPAGYDVRVASDGSNDVLYGGRGNDWMAGQTGDDYLYGGDGDDTLHGDDAIALPSGSAPGNDYLYGGAGNDRLFGNAGADFLYGEAGDDLLVGDGAGESGADTLYGGPGADTLRGADGDDVLYGEDGDDPELDGGNGNDVVYGGKGNDVLRGDGGTGSGNDVLYGDEGDDTLYGDSGNDILNGGLGHDTLEGGAGDDILDASNGNDILRGGAGNDSYRFVGTDAIFVQGIAETRIEDSAGSNRIVFGPYVFPGTVGLTVSGSDLIVRYGGLFGARVVGGASGSIIPIYEFSDGRTFTHAQMLAGAGLAFASINSTTAVTAISTGNDYIRGTAGVDNIDALAGDDVLFGDAGDDMLSGNDGKDTIDGGPGADLIAGGPGDDRLHGSSGNDVLDGGSGADALYGGDGDDELQGGIGNDRLEGGDGNDGLFGGDGDDVLVGGAGVDHLEGGAGFDEYYMVQGDDVATGTIIVDSGTNVISFEPGIVPRDVRLVFAAGNPDLTITYKGSSVFVPNGATGGVLSHLKFDGVGSMTYAYFFRLQQNW